MQELSGATPPAATANLLTGLNLDEIFTRTASGTTSTLLADALGSTIGLVGSSGSIATSYTYQPFGATTTGGTGNTNPYQFTGRENDGTGLYFYRARYYSPAYQRFVSQDPIAFAGHDTNLYGYSRQQPSGFTDPNGERPPFSNGAPIEIPINGPGSSPDDPPFPGPPGGALLLDSPGSTCPLAKPTPPPPYCFPGSGTALAIANGLATHEVSALIVESVIGVTAGPELIITALALDVAFGAPIDLIHGHACGDF